jgi:hypothetical protein
MASRKIESIYAFFGGFLLNKRGIASNANWKLETPLPDGTSQGASQEVRLGVRQMKYC